jgi:hypothetical protein
MLQLAVGTFFYSFQNLRNHELRAVGLQHEIEDQETLNGFKTTLDQTLEELFISCQRLGLHESQKIIGEVKLWARSSFFSYGALSAKIEVLRSLIENEGQQRLIYVIKREKGDLLRETPDPWQPIYDKFPSAKPDVRSARMCYALGEDTACVFHLMRVAETGLRALARERRVKIRRKPLEWANWQDVIRAIRAKTEPIGKWRAGPAKEAALDFYNGALGEFEAFKDAYRNNVMHARKSYSDKESASIMHHVCGFMTRLAAKVDERDIKAIKWGRR